MILIKIITVVVVFTAGNVMFAAQLADSNAVAFVRNYHDRVLPKLKGTNNYIVKSASRGMTDKDVIVEDGFLGRKILWAYSHEIALSLTFTTNRSTLVAAWCHPLEDKIKESCRQRCPELTLNEAVERARHYIEDLETSIPTNFLLSEVTFNKLFPSCWHVTWAPVISGFEYERDFAFRVQEAVVVFHETLGFVGFSYICYLPEPTITAVNVEREAAILKASRLAPLVFKTPFYQSCRMPGFKISGVKNAALKIVGPNWLLDPGRAKWGDGIPPVETRLCWVVRFTTVDEDSREWENRGKRQLIAPEIVVYIDSGTGECVGANFS